MPAMDAARWNQRYLENPSRYLFARPLLVENSALLPPSGLALDVAMGLGGNSAYLIDHGLKVIGVDISEVAIRYAQSKHSKLMPLLADLSEFSFPAQTFDVIINFYYLQRNFWVQFSQMLRLDGLLFLETLTQEMVTIKPDIDPSYLLEPGELRHLFSDWEIILYQEGWQPARNGSLKAVASLIARPPHNER